ncbi:DMT family transporter [Tropicibacter naphthalenivorans]|uniref:Phosphonate utilization associated putative membrane protein n=1 Tax=Tropicibacter naphthalenivorans TaxID=441103 RepID=A0A0P1GSL3_9RHOB|nr:DMT family transporter [Tropicibacter naphthalenivorans]CUH77070.1 phosphonate utilization associated putative membrane protein [Tropicibacter naphthalenivorans]SMC61110.1 Permease of the drug/metabolite transporter (DMT) superfamily [Tropicibacter naphthalenivorans]
MRAILLMVLSMGLLASLDVFVKLATQTAPSGQVMLLLSLGGTAMFILLARLKGIPLWTADARHPMLLWRNVAEIFGSIGMIVGVANTSLPVFAAITQAGPLVVTIGAAVFLREQVGWRRWVAVLVGLVGMLIVIRPWGASFTGWELFAVMGITALSARDLITRMSPANMHPIAISMWGFAATILPGIVLIALAQTPLSWEPRVWALVGCGVLVAVSGYLAVTTAMRLAPASTVAPFRYTRLIYAIFFGIVVFGDYPDNWTLLGSALILGAGLYSFMRERALARQTRLSPIAAVGIDPGTEGPLR